MAKFNSSSVGSLKTKNKAGGSAYKISDEKLKLITQVLTSFFKEPKYYGDNSKEIITTIRNVVAKDAKFIANLALYAREVFYMRSISHVLSAELAKSVEGKPFARKVIARVCQRPDDMTEILAYYLNTYGKPVPNSVKKGLADALKKFGEYHLAKYNRKQAVTLKDVIMIAHPRPDTHEQADLWKRILEDRLEVPYTWETELSTKGNTKEVWEELIASRKLGYMASLRNLRNMINSGAENFDQVLSYLTNPTAVANSKQLPFRFFSAHRELQSVSKAGSKVLDAIEDALALSVRNLPQLEGTTFLMNDNSGSMSSPLSAKSKVTYNEVGSLLMAVAQKFCENAITSVFGQEFKTVNVSTRNSIISNMNTFAKTNVGHATYMHLGIKWLVENKVKVDRIIVFSDEQTYSDRPIITYGWLSNRAKLQQEKSPQQWLEQYKREVNPDVWVHSIDLAGYGTTQFVGGNVNLIAGWSDKVLEFIKLAEEGFDTITNKIENYAQF